MEQRLYFKGVFLININRTLAHHGIRDGSFLDVKRGAASGWDTEPYGEPYDAS